MKLLIITLLFLSNLFSSEYASSKVGVKPVDNELYKNECSACHFDYQPGLLPSKSWKKIMSNLENHFDTDASLDNEDFQTISEYLEKNSAEKAMNYKRSRRIVNSIASNEIPQSITKVRYIIKKHNEIRPSLITQKEVKGLFNCTACHTTAQKGIYSERDIIIPNFGRWED
ncbi:MAG: diheme cytochrome c [Poseidonibacter sp.]|uniref:diheme cytochrome c n=1 Tax=Poseidonibacter sp. TaxID=2321188 RepID=UPI00359D3CD0